jgi:WD40 repeat protein
MVLGAGQGSDGAAAGPMAAWPRIAAGAVRAAGSRAGRRAMAAVSCAALLAGLGAAAPATASAGRGHGAASAGRAAVPGSRLWVSRYTGPAGSDNSARSVAVSPGGGTLFVTGTSRVAPARSDYATAAYDAATGAQRWASRYSGPPGHADYARSVAVSPDGATVFVTGGSPAGPAGTTSGVDYATVAYDAATGAQRWASRYNGPANGYDSAFAVAVSPDGATVFVTGTSQGATSIRDYATVAYNAATGAQRWARRYNGPQNEEDFAVAVATGPGGGSVFVTGTSTGAASGVDYATLAYNAATGARRWISRYNGPANGASSLAVSPGGATVFVTGSSRRATSGFDYATVAYNAATGARRWVSRYNGPRNKDDFAVSVAAGPGGRTAFVTGSSPGAASSVDYATVAYNAATGAPRWVRRYNGPASGADFASSLAVSPGGSAVFVTGTSCADTSGCTRTSLSAYATLAYSAATGARLWASRYHVPGGQSGASALTASPDGTKVFVTGTSLSDYATVAYQR